MLGPVAGSGVINISKSQPKLARNGQEQIVALFGEEDTRSMRSSKEQYYDLHPRRESVRPKGGEGTRRRAHWAHLPGSHHAEAYWRHRLYACLKAREEATYKLD